MKKLGFLLVMGIVGAAAVTGLLMPLTAGSDQSSAPAIAATLQTPAADGGATSSSAPSTSPVPIVTAAKTSPEMAGRYRSHTVFAREMDGQLVVMFMPALPHDERTVLGGAEYALRRFLKVTVVNAQWRTVLPYLRVTTGSKAFDVLLIKNDDGAVHSMVITKKG